MPSNAAIVTVLHKDVLLAFLNAITPDVAGSSDPYVELQEVDTERVQILTH